MQPKKLPQRKTNNIPYKIKKLIAKKSQVRSIWQRTHTPDSRRIYNQTSNKLKTQLQEMQNESFEKYISNLKREDELYLETYKK